MPIFVMMFITPLLFIYVEIVVLFKSYGQIGKEFLTDMVRINISVTMHTK